MPFGQSEWTRRSDSVRTMAEGGGSGPVEPELITVEHDGRTIGALDWGGNGPPLVFLHPNGFCAGVFDPLAQQVRADYRAIGVDLRGHGTSDAPTTYEDCGFVAAAGDVVAVLDALGLTDVLILGESLGGGAGILVDRQRPGLVRRLLLCEPIAMSGPGQRPGVPSLPGAEGENHMSALARRRRAVWADRATVRESYGSRPPLDVMEPAALDGYVRWGFRDRPDGQVELSCPPEVEAWFFECGDAARRSAGRVRAPGIAHRRRHHRERRRDQPPRRDVRSSGGARRGGAAHRARLALLRAGGLGPGRGPRARAPARVSGVSRHRSALRAHS